MHALRAIGADGGSFAARTAAAVGVGVVVYCKTLSEIVAVYYYISALDIGYGAACMLVKDLSATDVVFNILIGLLIGARRLEVAVSEARVEVGTLGA